MITNWWKKYHTVLASAAVSDFQKHSAVLMTDDIRAILAERHEVEPKDVIRNQYSYTVILNREKKRITQFKGRNKSLNTVHYS